MATANDSSPKTARSRWTEYAILTVVAVLVATGVRTWVLQTFFIPSESMEQTLLIDDRVIVNKIGHRFGGPERGEIVVFVPPAGWHAGPGQDYIKRVIGVAGDHVICCDDNNRVTVNGAALDEDYLFPGDAPSVEPFDVTVAPASIFVLGDHRSASGDSRVHLDTDNGAVGVDRVLGRAFVTFWPLSRARTLRVPDTFAGVPDLR
ncbi:signal peptidase I [Micromonosporaceae bacterium Da 78-11]